MSRVHKPLKPLMCRLWPLCKIDRSKASGEVELQIARVEELEFFAYRGSQEFAAT